MFVQLIKEFLGKKPGERIDVDKEHADTLIEKGLAAPVTDDPIGPAIAKGLESAFGKLNAALEKTVDEALKSFANAQTQAKKHAIPAIFGEGGEGDPSRTFGDYLLGVRRGDSKFLADKYKSYPSEIDTKTAMATTSGTAGGYYRPPRISAAIARGRRRGKHRPQPSDYCAHDRSLHPGAVPRHHQHADRGQHRLLRRLGGSVDRRSISVE